ncbi:MAG: glycosyltransferase [Candidatus Diapherotrites archaeon]|nr:glycosyltransferase [Candidatus Diapherotrites archaeon]
MAGIKASIIIPAYNAEKTIDTTLMALQNQNFPKEQFEVIVVDDGSTDQTTGIVNKFKTTKLIQQKNSGPALARNTGAKLASGEVLIFTDSDCVPEKNWLNEMLQPFEDQSISGVQGAYKTHQKEWMAQFVQLEIEERYERMKKSKQLDWIGTYSAGYRKSIYLQEKGFDEQFSKASGEDSDLSYRLQEKGFKLIFNPNAIVYHKHPTSLTQYLEKKFQHAYWRVLLYKKHPKKISHDSYTPGTLKLQLIFTIVLGISLVLFVFAKIYAIIAIWAIIFLLITMTPFVLFAARRNILLSVLAPCILFLRTIAFLAGLAKGILVQNSRKG